MAGGFGTTSDDEIISGINITPLVDVILVLLIIFLITAPAIYRSSIKVQLPRAHSGEKTQKTPLNFTLDKEGKLTWDNQNIQWSEIPNRLKQFGNQLTEETAMINADQATPHGTVIKLMDILKQAGLSHFALTVIDENTTHSR